MVKRDDLITTINTIIGEDLVKEAQFKDSYANGVQIVGNEEVTKVALGVSTSLEFLQEAVSTGAEFTITHHGLDLTSHNIIASRLHPGIQELLTSAITNNLTVAGYHFSLDSHSEIGNNATIIRELGANRLDITYSGGWGWVGEFDKPRDVKELANQCSDLFNHDIFAVYAGSKKIKRIGVCSGGAKPYDRDLWEIIDNRLDLHLSGEIIEAGPGLAKGIGFNYFSCGHYATEVFGVQELGKKIKEHYGDKLEVEFIDIPNPL